MCGKNNLSTGTWERGGKDISFRKSFTDMKLELPLKAKECQAGGRGDSIPPRGKFIDVRLSTGSFE